MDRCLTAFKRYAAGTGDFQNVKFVEYFFDRGDLVGISDGSAAPEHHVHAPQEGA